MKKRIESFEGSGEASSGER